MTRKKHNTVIKLKKFYKKCRFIFWKRITFGIKIFKSKFLFSLEIQFISDLFCNDLNLEMRV